MAVQIEGLQRRGSHWCGQWERGVSSKSAAASAAQKALLGLRQEAQGEGRGCSRTARLQASLPSRYRWVLHRH